MNKSRLEFAEQTSIVFSNWGLSHSQGKILGWLMVCDPHNQNVNELSKNLMISKSSVSTSTKFLTNINFIEKTRIAGHRTEYYQLSSKIWSAIFANTFETIHTMKTLSKIALSQEMSSQKQFPILYKLNEMFNLYDKQLHSLVAKWSEIEPIKMNPQVQRGDTI